MIGRRDWRFRKERSKTVMILKVWEMIGLRAYIKATFKKRNSWDLSRIPKRHKIFRLKKTESQTWWIKNNLDLYRWEWKYRTLNRQAKSSKTGYLWKDSNQVENRILLSKQRKVNYRVMSSKSSEKIITNLTSIYSQLPFKSKGEIKIFSDKCQEFPLTDPHSRYT